MINLKNYVKILGKNENVIFELWKRCIRTLKKLHSNFETFYPNFENVYIRTLETLFHQLLNVIENTNYFATVITPLPGFNFTLIQTWTPPSSSEP